MAANSSMTFEFTRFPFAHTYSIVARDPQTGDLGVAVQTHWFSTGSLVTWAEPGVGVIATQAMVEVSYGPKGLAGLREHRAPQDVLDELLKADNGRDIRQVAMVDVKGRVATHTGTRTVAEAGHHIGAGYSVQANMMLRDTVWPAMAAAYEASSGPLPERLLSALDAAQAEGGDIRGMQSAAMLVVSGKVTDQPWAETLLDLRIDDHPTPLIELRRLLKIQRAYESMNRGDALLGSGDFDGALLAYSRAREYAPDIDEIPFWQAVTLADTGRFEESVPYFRAVFAINPNWALLVQRLPKAGFIKNDPDLIARIVALAR